MSKLMINVVKESYNSTPPKAFPSREFWICSKCTLNINPKFNTLLPWQLQLTKICEANY
jgi:hypothetical protein